MIKTKYKRILCVLVVILVLFLFLAVPASAYSTVIDQYDPLVPGSSSYYSTCPVPLELNANYLTVVDSVSSSFQLAASINPIVSFYDYTFTNFTQVNDKAPIYGSWSGYSSPLSSDFEIFDSDTQLNIIGTASFYHSGYKFSLNSTYFDNSSLAGYNIYLRDFYIWNYNFDSRINTNSEISLLFDYSLMSSRVLNVEFYYSIAGSNEIVRTVLSASDFSGSENGEFIFSPAVLGIDDENAVIYVYQCVFSFDNVPSSTMASLLEVTTVYTFNPYLDNFGDLDDDPESENPALNLLPFTTWLGEAMSGFMDFEIYDGFSLGGIFMTLFAFTCVMWFLKLVAGG